MTTAGMTAANPTAHETLRKADLDVVARLLESQRARTVDLSIKGRSLWVAGGNLIVQGVSTNDDGPDVNGMYAFGEVGLESFAARLDLPRNHLKEWRAHRTDLFDTVTGYFLRGEMNGEQSPYIAPDERVHTLRLLRADDSADNDVDGMVRAALGGTYLALDNLDALNALMEGMYEAGIGPDVCKIEADLTESRMVIKVWVPALYALAPQAFSGYRSPYSGQTTDEMPKVYAGLVFSDSEVGRGAWSVAPRIVYEACTNGTTITKDVFEKRHVGERLDGNGVIKWSQETQLANLELIKKQTADAVRTYLDVDYLKAKLDEMAEQAGVRVTEEPEQVIAKVTRHTGHTGARSSILAMYTAGGQYTAGGVMQAYTAAAQATRSGDLAYDLENHAAEAMAWVAAHAG